MILDAILSGASSSIQAFLDSVWEDANRAVLLSVIGGIFLYFVRSWADGRRTAQSLARVLHFELEENQRQIMGTWLAGMPRADPMRVNGVYSGLIASGNIRYLHKHQETLYRLYSITRSDDPKLPGALEGAIISIGGVAFPSMRGKLASMRRTLRRRP